VVIRFFTLKGLKARTIQLELVSVYGLDALALSTMKKWRRCFQQGRTDLFDDPRSGRPLMHDLGEIIRSVLEERSFTSYKVLCRHFRVDKAMCLRILHDTLDLKKFHLRWVPHALSSNQKNERVSDSRLLLVALEQNKATLFQGVITGDESWFFLYYPRDSMWDSSQDDLPDKIK
jgi:transposase